MPKNDDIDAEVHDARAAVELARREEVARRARHAERAEEVDRAPSPRTRRARTRCARRAGSGRRCSRARRAGRGPRRPPRCRRARSCGTAGTRTARGRRRTSAAPARVPVIVTARAGVGERARDRVPDARRAAGDEHVRAGEVERRRRSCPHLLPAACVSAERYIASASRSSPSAYSAVAAGGVPCSTARAKSASSASYERR